MARNKEILYSILSLADNTAYETQLFKYGKYEFDNNGFLLVKNELSEARLYRPEWYYILGSKKLSVIGSDSKKQTQISGFNYINAYIDAFKKGAEYFSNEIKPAQNILYGDKGDLFINDLKIKYNQWNAVKLYFPIIISDSIICKYAYYSGIISEADSFITANPSVFADFYEAIKMMAKNISITSLDEPIIHQTKTKWTLSTFALFLIYLRNGKEDDVISTTLKHLPELCDKYSYTGSSKSLSNTISAYLKKQDNINSKSVQDKDPATIDNLSIVIGKLEKFKTAKKLAQQDLYKLQLN